jgi:hypothetical protein
MDDTMATVDTDEAAEATPGHMGGAGAAVPTGTAAGNVPGGAGGTTQEGGETSADLPTPQEQMSNSADQVRGASTYGEGRPYDRGVEELASGADQGATHAERGGGPDSEWGREGN